MHFVLCLSAQQHIMKTWNKAMLEYNTYGKHWRTSQMVSLLFVFYTTCQRSFCISFAESIHICIHAELITKSNVGHSVTDNVEFCVSEDRSRFLRFVTGRSRLPAPIYIFPDKQG